MVGPVPLLDSQLFAALLGAVVGFLLAEISAISRERRQDQKQRGSVRTALHYEIADNLAKLTAFWPQVVGKDNGRYAGSNLLGLVVPAWSTAIWKSMTAATVVALTQEEQAKVHVLYSTLAEISDAQRRLAQISSDDIASRAAAEDIPTGVHWHPTTRAYAPQNFDRTAKILMPALDEKVDSVLATGNPIALEGLAILRASRTRFGSWVTR
jgi:hypothetical protein